MTAAGAQVGHVALIVEDDDAIAKALASLVASLGHTSRRAATLEEVRAALAPGEGPYCYALLDMQIPSHAGEDPDVGCGETALELLRSSDPSRTAEGIGKHRFQIIVVTGFSREQAFTARMYEMEADGFIPKPLGEKHDMLRDRIRRALGQAERADHAACGRPREATEPPLVSARAPERRGPIVARVEIDALRGTRKIGFLVNGKRRMLQDAKFVPFLQLAAASERGELGHAAWRSRDVLRIVHAPEVPSRIGDAFEGLVPEGFVVVERDGEGSFRLNPGIEVAMVDWAALEGHPSADVREVARGEREWREARRLRHAP